MNWKSQEWLENSEEDVLESVSMYCSKSPNVPVLLLLVTTCVIISLSVSFFFTNSLEWI